MALGSDVPAGFGATPPGPSDIVVTAGQRCDWKTIRDAGDMDTADAATISKVTNPIIRKPNMTPPPRCRECWPGLARRF